jgi:hypothetical protein
VAVTVDSITLFIFGGVSNLSTEATTAGDELLVAVVGPVSSFVLTGVFWLLNQTLPGTSSFGAVVGYLAFINLLLGAFNLVPGFPLDGGRVLRSLIWGGTGDLQRATLVASYAGQAFGGLLILWGLARLLGGDLLGGLWSAFIGWFLNGAAESTRHEQAQRETLRGVRVGSLMDPSPVVAAPNLSVQDFVFEDVCSAATAHFWSWTRGVTLGEAKKLSQEAWPAAYVSKIMTVVPPEDGCTGFRAERGDQSHG